MNSVKLLWVTPLAETQILRMARVSSKNRDSKNTKLINYLLKNAHYSPFEMCNMTVEITTSRAISKQIIRHRSFSFQEFSQRYAVASTEFHYTEARRQDLKNRQNSIDDLSIDIKNRWKEKQYMIFKQIREDYQWALDNGIAKECARSILPEGNTKTILCMNGTLRSWIHYLQLRCGNGTQKEHMEVANMIKDVFVQSFPIISQALGWAEEKTE